MEYQGNSPVELFLRAKFGSISNAAKALDLVPTTIAMWRDRPERMLRYIVVLRNMTGATLEELVQVYEAGVTWNEQNG